MILGTVVVTGAAGLVGSAVRGPLGRAAQRLVLVDQAPIRAEAPNETAHQVKLTSVDDIAPLIDGADVVVHLAGIPDEAPLPDLMTANVVGTHHVLEAARRTGVPRVVIASSNRLTGAYPIGETLSPDDPLRPDGLYGVSKAAVEALGRLYVDKFGLEVVCVRIGSLEDRPQDGRHLATWLSPRDCAGFFVAALTMKMDGFAAFYAVSANTRRFWELSDVYTPQDNAEDFARDLDDPDAFFIPTNPQGGPFASQEYTLRHITP
ncbi:NAD-dependent epimerase/dehydratase family protein [Nonomuraea sp. NPDC050556]|uniref:NAD-dependent epimerase/dehydratase family protein n=1 Tax=Nonomuraea sp. NPDC050556 TaxID=3364369 RepID=UPI00378A301F